MAQEDYIFPIAGTKKIGEENVGSLDISFTKKEPDEVSVFPKDAAAGFRYPETMMKSING